MMLVGHIAATKCLIRSKFEQITKTKRLKQRTYVIIITLKQDLVIKKQTERVVALDISII